jgi:hypothetical protein
MYKDNFVKLLESNLEKSEIVLAVQNIADEIQKMIKKLGEIKLENIAPLSDRIKAVYGVKSAEDFTASISTNLAQAIEQLSTVREEINTKSLVLSGDVSDSDMENDLTEPSEEEPVDEIQPESRIKKESLAYILNGKKYKKLFESEDDMNHFIIKNKITRFVVIKD